MAINIWIDKPKKVGGMWQIRFRHKEPGYKPKYETWPADEYSERFVNERVKDLKAKVRLGEIDPWKKELSIETKGLLLKDAVKVYFKKIDVVDRTYRLYNTIISGFAEWYGETYLLDSVSEKDIHKFAEKKCEKVSSENTYIGVLNGFFQWCKNKGYLEKEIHANIKKIHHKKFPHILNEEEFWDIYKKAKTLIETPKQERSLYTFPIYFYTGVRRSELPNMKVSDFLLSKERAVVGSTERVKSKKSRTIYLPPDCHEYVAKLSKGKSPGEPIYDERHITRSNGLMQVASTLFTEATTKVFPDRDLTLHSLRHSCACWMLEVGLSIMFVKEQLGHAKLETTMVYAKMTGKAFDSELERIGR